MRNFIGAAVIASLAIAHSAAAQPGRLTVVIHHLYNGKPLVFEAPNTTAAGERIAVSRLAYLLSEPSLRATSDGQWLTSRNWFAFADAQRGDAAPVLDQLPNERFDALRFHIGPDAATDRADPSKYPAQHALNPLVNGLHWGWAGGFVFLALEGHAQPGNDGFSYHLAGPENRMEVTLPIGLNLERDQTIELDFHVDRLFAGATPLTIAQQNSTHSRAGDSVPRHIKGQAEIAFTVRSVHNSDPVVSASQAVPVNLGGAPFTLALPAGVPVPNLPTDFPLTQQRVALGRRLFHETRLSGNRSQSCASCHDAKLGFGDRRAFSIGAGGEMGGRNAMPLFNLAWKSDFSGTAAHLRYANRRCSQSKIRWKCTWVSITWRTA